MKKVLQFIVKELAAGRPVVSPVIISSTGSTPRSTGSRMALAEDGRSAGSVGGGPAEARAMEKAMQIFNDKKSFLLAIDFTGREAARAGLICGGRQEILLEYIAPGEESFQLYSRLLENWDQSLGSTLFTAFESRDSHISIIARTLDISSLAVSLPASLINRAAGRRNRSRLPESFRENSFILFQEPLYPPVTLYVAGAGHVGQAAAELASSVGFATIVLDDRPEFLTRDRFPRAGKLFQVPDFADYFSAAEPDLNSFILIVTRGHVHDRNVLAQALTARAGYIGMIGSVKKRDAIYHSLLNQGISQDQLDRVHCPVGLPIGADTPEEIAVSIVAQLIQVRSKK
ncbi:MAG: XdhC family aldehyde oxidoreductase maturation factor [Desulfonatronovibrionaceae bacterium]